MTPEEIKAADEAKAAAAAAEGGGEGEGEAGGEEKVTMTKAEHDALQARLRIVEKQERERADKAAAKKRAAAEAAEAERIKAAEEAGLGAQAALEKAEREALKAENLKLRADNLIRDALETRDWSDDAKRLAKDSIKAESLKLDENGQPTIEGINESLDSLADQYSTFFAPAQRQGDTQEGKKPASLQSPSQRSKAEAGVGGPFEGYISEEQYMNTPQEARLKPEFHALAEKSRAYWDHQPMPKDTSGSGA